MTRSLDAMLSELVRRWEARGIPVGPGASTSQMREWEVRHHARCPDDFETYLLRVGGMPGVADWDDHLIRFLPLAEIEPAAMPQPSFEGYFLFADYSLSAHAYGIRLSPPDHSVALIHDPGSRIVAASFTDFLHGYLENPTQLFLV